MVGQPRRRKAERRDKTIIVGADLSPSQRCCSRWGSAERRANLLFTSQLTQSAKLSVNSHEYSRIVRVAVLHSLHGRQEFLALPFRLWPGDAQSLAFITSIQ